MKARPMGMLWMMPAGWLNDLPGAASRALKALPEGRLAHGTNMFTLLALEALPEGHLGHGMNKSTLLDRCWTPRARTLPATGHQDKQPRKPSRTQPV